MKLRLKKTKNHLNPESPKQYSGFKRGYIIIPILLLLLLVFPLNKYRMPEPIYSFPANETITSVPAKEKDQSRAIREKKKAPATVPERKTFIAEKLEVPEIKIQTITSAGNPDFILPEMKDLAANNRDTLKMKRFYIPPVEYKLNPKNLILPVALIATGSIASQTKTNRDFISFNRTDRNPSYTAFDDIAQYCVAPSLFLFDAIGNEKHHPADQVFLMGISYGLTALEVRNLKDILKETRPNGGNNSFPSGHTAVAFVGAHMIYKEFKDSNPWIAYSGYALATAVGTARVINNRHWVCDVLAGAGFAILSTELAYFIYFPVRNLITNGINKHLSKYILVYPVLHTGSAGLQMNIRF